MHSERIADDRQSDAGVPGGAVDDQSPLAQLALFDRIHDDSERRAVLDGLSRVHEFGLAEDGAAGVLRDSAKLDQRRVPDRLERAWPDVHGGACTASGIARVAAS